MSVMVWLDLREDAVVVWKLGPWDSSPAARQQNVQLQTQPSLDPALV